MTYVKKEHYISRYILRRFADSNEKIDAVLLKNPIKRIRTSVDKTCSERDFFEDFTDDGEYIDRNSTENIFGEFENFLSSKMNAIISILENMKIEEVTSYFESKSWHEKESWIMLHIALMLCRIPKTKEIVFKRTNLSLQEKQLLYKDLILGTKYTKALVETSFPEYKNEISHALEKGETKGAISVLSEDLLKNYYIKFFKASGEKSFFMTDNPILVNLYEDADYLLPFTPSFIIGAKKYPETDHFSYTPISVLDDKVVDSINKKLIERANRVVIVQNMTDENYRFIEKCLK